MKSGDTEKELGCYGVLFVYCL